MKYSEEYLSAKKIVAIEEISKIIMENKDCLDADLRSLINNQAVIDEIGIVLTKGETNELMVREIRKIFDKYKIEQ